MKFHTVKGQNVKKDIAIFYIKKKFHELRKLIDKGEEFLVEEEWYRMKQLLVTIIFAFA